MTSILSFGAGVQSTALILMYYYGDLTPLIDFAVFADTGAEPKPTYEFFKKIKAIVSDKIEIIETTKGNIVEDTLKESERSASIPFYVRNQSGERGMVKRQCTNEYKIQPVLQAIRKRLGYEKGERVKHKVNLVIGISTDEMRRMRQSQTSWIKNDYPLVFQKNMSRAGCLRYIESKGIKDVPKSACYICPFRSNSEWRWLRDNDPESWEKAIIYDNQIRKSNKYDGECYLHYDLKPIQDVNIEIKIDGQGDLFSGLQNECLGYCGN